MAIRHQLHIPHCYSTLPHDHITCPRLDRYLQIRKNIFCYCENFRTYHGAVPCDRLRNRGDCLDRTIMFLFHRENCSDCLDRTTMSVSVGAKIPKACTAYTECCGEVRLKITARMIDEWTDVGMQCKGPP